MSRGSEVVGLDQVAVIDDPVIPLGLTFGHNPLMPNMGWLVHHGQAELFIQLPRQGFQRRLGRLDTSTGSSPDDHALGGQIEPAQEYAILLVQDDRWNRMSEVGVGHNRRLTASADQRPQMPPMGRW